MPATYRSLKQLDAMTLYRNGSNLVTGSIDFDYHPVQHIVIQSGASLPGTAASGQLFYRTGAFDTLWYFNGTTWIELGTSGATAGGGSEARWLDLSSPTSRLRLPFDTTDSYTFQNKLFLMGSSPTPAEAADVGDIGYYQDLLLKHKIGMLVTNTPAVHVDFRVGQFAIQKNVAIDSHFEQDILPGSGGSVVIEHNLGDADHVVMVSVNQFNGTLSVTDLASLGQIWVEVGANQDTIHNTGISGIKFDYFASTSPFNSSVLAPNGITGVAYNHSLGTENHITVVTPITGTPWSSSIEQEFADLGEIYVVLGQNTDMIYATGNPVTSINLRIIGIELT